MLRYKTRLKVDLKCSKPIYYWLYSDFTLFLSAGCERDTIDKIPIENGRWHCPLHDDLDKLVGPGLQCFAMCNDFYELHDGAGGHYTLNKFSKICKCSEENNRCHWARLDKVPVCKATKLNRIINGQTAVANSKPYMVSVAVKTKTSSGKGGKERVFYLFRICLLIFANTDTTVTNICFSDKQVQILTDTSPPPPCLWQCLCPYPFV